MRPGRRPMMCTIQWPLVSETSTNPNYFPLKKSKLLYIFFSFLRNVQSVSIRLAQGSTPQGLINDGSSMTISIISLRYRWLPGFCYQKLPTISLGFKFERICLLSSRILEKRICIFKYDVFKKAYLAYLSYLS